MNLVNSLTLNQWYCEDASHFLNIGKQRIAPCMAAMYFNHFVYDLILLRVCELDLRILKIFLQLIL